jgi:hypothetical protein
VLYNVGWFACVFFAANGQPWVGNAAIALVVCAHLLSMPAWKKEALLLAIAGLIGLVWETALVWSGLLAYPAAPGIGILAPSWIVAMWILFATTINVSLSWVKRSWWLAALFGGLGGPLAFVAGKALGAVEFGDPILTPLAIGVGWAVLLPVICLIAETIIDGTFLEPGYRRTRNMSLLQQAQMLLSGKLSGKGLDK